METFQQTPTTPLPLFPTPPIVPAQCVPCGHRNPDCCRCYQSPSHGHRRYNHFYRHAFRYGNFIWFVHMFAFRSSWSRSIQSITPTRISLLPVVISQASEHPYLYPRFHQFDLYCSSPKDHVVVYHQKVWRWLQNIRFHIFNYINHTLDRFFFREV